MYMEIAIFYKNNLFYFPRFLYLAFRLHELSKVNKILPELYYVFQINYMPNSGRNVRVL